MVHSSAVFLEVFWYAVSLMHEFSNISISYKGLLIKAGYVFTFTFRKWHGLYKIHCILITCSVNEVSILTCTVHTLAVTSPKMLASKRQNFCFVFNVSDKLDVVALENLESIMIF